MFSTSSPQRRVDVLVDEEAPYVLERVLADEILEEMPDLEREDLQACLRFASRWVDHPVLVA